MKVIVYRLDNNGDGLVFVEITDEKYPCGMTPEQFYDSEESRSRFKKLGVFDLPGDFLSAIGFKKGIMDARVCYED